MRIAAAVLALLLSACTVAVRDLPNYKHEGLSRVYPVTNDQAWTIARQILRGLDDIDAIEERRDEGYLLTSTGMGGWTYGTVIGVWFERVSEASTRVTVVTKRRLQTNAVTSLTETTFQRRFAQTVDMLKATRP